MTNFNCFIFKEAMRFFDAAPIRLACLHQCTDKSLGSELFLAIGTLLLRGRVRHRLHLEDGLESKFQLMSFGVPADCKFIAALEL